MNLSQTSENLPSKKHHSEKQFPQVPPIKPTSTDSRIPSPNEMRTILSAPRQRSILKSYETVIKIAEAAKAEGGQAFMVGGSVRDILLGIPAKDFDIEIHRIPADIIEMMTRRFGKVSRAGKSFEVLKVWPEDGIDIDVSLPRTDSKVSPGHKGFIAKANPNLGLTKALQRRDFTINAMAADPLTGEIFDPYEGMVDLKHSLLRIVDPKTFVDDPLRALRALQFIGRFDLRIDPASAIEIKNIAPTLKELSKERLLEEWIKLLTKSPYPSLGLNAGIELGIFAELHPELVALQSVRLDQKRYPEGDAWTHTLLATDMAATIAHREGLDMNEAIVLMLATLLHKLYKFDQSIESPADRNEIAVKFLKTLGLERTKIAQRVLKLLDLQHKPHELYLRQQINAVADGTFRRLALAAAPASLYELSLLAEANDRGRGPLNEHTGYYEVQTDSPLSAWFLERCQKLGVDKEKPGNIIEGRDIIEIFSCKPGQHIGLIIRLANDLRDEQNYTREQILVLLTASLSPDDAAQVLQREIDRVKNISPN